jgi:hypothetical protein
MILKEEFNLSQQQCEVAESMRPIMISIEDGELIKKDG